MNHPYYHTYSEHPLIPTHKESWVIENLLNNEPLPAIYDTVLRTNPRGDQKQHKHLYTYTEDQIGRRTYMNPTHIAAKAVATHSNPHRTIREILDGSSTAKISLLQALYPTQNTTSDGYTWQPAITPPAHANTKRHGAHNEGAYILTPPTPHYLTLRIWNQQPAQAQQGTLTPFLQWINTANTATVVLEPQKEKQPPTATLTNPETGATTTHLIQWKGGNISMSQPLRAALSDGIAINISPSRALYRFTQNKHNIQYVDHLVPIEYLTE